jgi:hypothetical protein
MLGKLKIRCIYEKNGCKEILCLNNLDNHQNKCRFDKMICEKCSCVRSSGHDCVNSLLELKHNLIQNNEQLQKELNLATDKIKSMKSEIKNYLQTIEELSKSNNTIDVRSLLLEVLNY